MSDQPIFSSGNPPATEEEHTLTAEVDQLVHRLGDLVTWLNARRAHASAANVQKVIVLLDLAIDSDVDTEESYP